MMTEGSKGDRVFGIFKKKQPTGMDGVIRAIYGDSPPAKSADLERSVTIAHEDLLSEAVPISQVQRVAFGLFSSPMPYSTHDLSVATALSFFKDPALVGRLKEIQLGARLRVLNWMKAGKVAPGVLKIFEDTLYRVYKPTAETADDELSAKFEAFKKQNTGRTLHEAARVVRELMIWQAGFAEGDKPDDPSESQVDHAREVERAFLIGAAGMAAEAFSIQEADETLFLMNVVGTYMGLGPDEVENEMAEMLRASEMEEKATKIGGAVMIDYLTNGKADKHKVHLAALQRKCWGQ
jgi:hypothetical protein